MLYYFFGPDQWGIKEAISEVIANSKVDKSAIIRFDGPELEAKALEQEIISVSFFSPWRVLIVSDLSANRKETEVERILSMLGKDFDHLDIIFYENNPDKRTALHKRLLKNAKSREFKNLQPGEVREKIKLEVRTQGSSISNQAANLLGAMIPTDSLRLKEEIKKLSLLRRGEEIVEDDVNEMVVAEINSNIFNFVESLAAKNLKGTYQALNKLTATGQNENYILSMIAWQFRQIIVVRSVMEKGKATPANSGINPYVFGKVESLAKKYSLKELSSIYQLIEKADFAIKTGELEAGPALELVAGKILNC